MPYIDITSGKVPANARYYYKRKSWNNTWGIFAYKVVQGFWRTGSVSRAIVFISIHCRPLPYRVIWTQ
ncbi:MAG: hypothetical protein JXB88_23840 [Spirochaetales bacterium]|nr:hypothetical protein [Spirochaetales bacterium]